MAKLHVSNSITSEKFGNDYAIIVMACFFVSSLTVFLGYCYVEKRLTAHKQIFYFSSFMHFFRVIISKFCAWVILPTRWLPRHFDKIAL